MMKRAYKVEKFELELPEDVVLCLKSTKAPTSDINGKIKIALGVDLFTQGAVSLAKAASIAGMTRYRFMLLLKDRGIPAYEYTEDAYRQDQEAIKEYKRIKDEGSG